MFFIWCVRVCALCTNCCSTFVITVKTRDALPSVKLREAYSGGNEDQFVGHRKGGGNGGIHIFSS